MTAARGGLPFLRNLVGGETEEGVVIAETVEAEIGDRHPDLDAPVRTTGAHLEIGSESDLSHPGILFIQSLFLCRITNDKTCRDEIKHLD